MKNSMVWKTVSLVAMVAAVAQVPLASARSRGSRREFRECRQTAEATFMEQGRAARGLVEKDFENLNSTLNTLNAAIKGCVEQNTAASTGADGCVETAQAAANAQLPAFITSYSTDYAAWLTLKAQVRSEVESQCGPSASASPTPTASPAPAASTAPAPVPAPSASPAV